MSRFQNKFQGFDSEQKNGSPDGANPAKQYLQCPGVKRCKTTRNFPERPNFEWRVLITPQTNHVGT